MLLRNVIFDIILPVVVTNACEGDIFNTPSMNFIIKSNIQICRLPQNVTSVSNQKLLCNVIMIHCPTVVCNFRPPITIPNSHVQFKYASFTDQTRLCNIPPHREILTFCS